jgi:hypothetical protein
VIFSPCPGHPPTGGAIVIFVNLLVLLVMTFRGYGSHAELSGIVSTLDYGELARVGNARLQLRNSRGITFTATANELGEYTASLNSGYDCEMTVTAEGFCSVNRPSFPANPDSHLRFDFTLTTDCPGDGIAVGPDPRDAYFASTIPHYFEESIPLSKKTRGSLIVSFGRRVRLDNLLTYAPLPIRGHPDVQIPVTMSMLTNTVRADRAVLDENTGLLRAEGNVSIADGSSSPPQVVSCAAVRLDDPEPQVRLCQ